MNDTIDSTSDLPQYALKFTEHELEMLGQTADALSAYMGCVVLAEVGINEFTEWVIFARAIGQDETPGEDVLHVQIGGSGSRILGQKGGLDATAETLDCEFLWAVEITEDPDERYVRLNQDGEVFDSANDLATLLPFSLQEPEVTLEADEETEDQDEADGPSDVEGESGHDDQPVKPPTLH